MLTTFVAGPLLLTVPSALITRYGYRGENSYVLNRYTTKLKFQKNNLIA